MRSTRIPVTQPQPFHALHDPWLGHSTLQMLRSGVHEGQANVVTEQAIQLMLEQSMPKGESK